MDFRIKIILGIALFAFTMPQALGGSPNRNDPLLASQTGIDFSTLRRGGEGYGAISVMDSNIKKEKMESREVLFEGACTVIYQRDEVKLTVHFSAQQVAPPWSDAFVLKSKRPYHNSSFTLDQGMEDFYLFYDLQDSTGSVFITRNTDPEDIACDNGGAAAELWQTAVVTAGAVTLSVRLFCPTKPSGKKIGLIEFYNVTCDLEHPDRNMLITEKLKD